jgi:hypothetical protein
VVRIYCPAAGISVPRANGSAKSIYGKPMTLPRHPAEPDVVIDGRKLGSAWWSMSEEPLVNVSVEPSALPLVLEWAKELGGEFQQENWGDG